MNTPKEILATFAQPGEYPWAVHVDEQYLGAYRYLERSAAGYQALCEPRNPALPERLELGEAAFSVALAMPAVSAWSRSWEPFIRHV